jgi:hypothetical protein
MASETGNGGGFMSNRRTTGRWLGGVRNGFAKGRVLAVVMMLALAAFALPSLSAAQTPAGPTEAVKAIAGTWELSNAERDRSCNVILSGDVAPRGHRLELERTCAAALPVTKDAVAWTLGAQEAIRLLDARGRTVLEFNEVESGLYEAQRPGEGLLFLQNIAAAKDAQERTADRMLGDWAVVRGAGRPICRLTLSNTVAAQDSFALQLQPGCDSLVTRFGPVAWRMERGQLVLAAANGEVWRFEEGDPTTWRRIPEGRQPLHLVRQ